MFKLCMKYFYRPGAVRPPGQPQIPVCQCSTHTYVRIHKKCAQANLKHSSFAIIFVPN